MPEEEPMVATDILLLLHVPNGVPSVSTAVAPKHTPTGPPIAAGSGLTVTTAVAIHVVGSVYVILTVFADTPVTAPAKNGTVATAGLLLLHVPPTEASSNEVVALTQTCMVPVMGEGNGLTVTSVVRIHPVASV